MALSNATRPARGGPVTPDQLARLRAALADSAGHRIEVPASVMRNVVHDLDVLARLREVVARAVVPTIHPDVVRQLVRDDHRLRDEARE